MTTTLNPAEEAPLPQLYSKQVVDRILQVVRSIPHCDPGVEEEILDIAADCEPSPPAPPVRLYDTREDAQRDIKAFAAHHGYVLTVRRSDQVKVDILCARWPEPKSKARESATRENGDRSKMANGCPFRLQLRKRLKEPEAKHLVPEGTMLACVWSLRIANGTHNHGRSRHVMPPAYSPAVAPEIAHGHLLAAMLPHGNGTEPMENALSRSMQGTVPTSTGPLQSSPSPPLPSNNTEARDMEDDAEEKGESDAASPALRPGPPPAPPPAIYVSREAGHQAVIAFAARHGYSLTVKRSDTMKSDFVCSCWPDPEHVRSRKTKGTNCKFALQLRKRTGPPPLPPNRPELPSLPDTVPLVYWELRIRNGEHNHVPTPPQTDLMRVKKRKRQLDIQADLRPASRIAQGSQAPRMPYESPMQSLP
ncbi:hypothetical protein N7539_003906 [Penicillium diatomitis]|uniref:Uncharacterized protein n=1 Tax=Penicillium diatomitis TaxID=2819901 RepID=A0A9W9XD52_9EURO|nr:uncharacterized protein N7539_003906 [Penicillium diatomitis]KAJ5489016.1 hypothetical protein N7539_003906 [Penicillium diatomitis]